MDIQTKDGILLRNIPDGTSDDVIKARLQEIRGNKPMPQQPMVEQRKNYSLSEVPGAALSNIPSSTVNMVSGIANALAHPIDTAGSVLTAGAGGLGKMLPESVNKFLNRADEAVLGKQLASERFAKEAQAANAIGQLYKDRYGSAEGIKRTIAEDPMGVLADVSTVTTGGAALAPKAGKLATMLSKTASVTNPLAPVEKLAGKLASGVGEIGKGAIATTTQVGKEAVNQALKSGELGNEAFLSNLRGTSSMGDVLDLAKSSLDNIKQNKSSQYRSGMVDIKNDKTALDFNDIDNAINSARNKVSYKGEIKDEFAADKVAKAQQAVSDWKNLDPNEYHTPEGMDALKQKIGGILESIPYEQKTARSAVQDIYNSTRKTISDQAPTYSKVMKDYSEASDLIKEIEKGLSLGNKASADTSMRKLQSLMRNNVNTNYGQRLKLAEELAKNGGENLMPSLAGQAMSSYAPRGLVGQGEQLAGVGALLTNPSALVYAPLASPKLMGEALYKMGQGKNALKKAAGKIPMTADQANQAAMLLYQMNNANQGEQ
jgi:hypothetical protein